jgi:hypothetical protein
MFGVNGEEYKLCAEFLSLDLESIKNLNYKKSNDDYYLNSRTSD